MATASWSAQAPHPVRHLYWSRLDHSSPLPVTHVRKFISLVTCILPFICFFLGGVQIQLLGFMLDLCLTRVCCQSHWAVIASNNLRYFHDFSCTALSFGCTLPVLSCLPKPHLIQLPPLPQWPPQLTEEQTLISLHSQHLARTSRHGSVQSHLPFIVLSSCEHRTSVPFVSVMASAWPSASYTIVAHQILLNS